MGVRICSTYLGYNAYIISTVVDEYTHEDALVGYNAYIISTVVDWNRKTEEPKKAIMPI